MSEWKKYDETEYTDFGSVGETMPADGPGFGYSGGDRTMPADGEAGLDSSFMETIPDIPSSNTPTDGWDSAESTYFENGSITNDEGQTVRPATGWLVCIEGATRGMDYRIYSGYTYIGRDPAQNQIAIPDHHISAVPSARVLYDVESRKFYINETNGARNPVYLNGNLFESNRVELHPYDIIKLGKTRLLFVPLCTEKFAWGDD